MHKCLYELWAPGDRNPIENRAFSLYAMSEEENNQKEEEVIETDEDSDIESDIQRFLFEEISRMCPK
jgi:hypothetical protein